MEKEFVPYDIALAMKELGFDDIPCLAVYYGDVEDELRSWGVSQIDDNDNFKYVHYEKQYYAQKGFKNGMLAPLYQQAFDYLMSFLDDEDFLIFYKNGNVDMALKKSEVIECENKDACLRKLIEIVENKPKQR